MKFTLTLSENNVRRILSNKPVQLRNEQLHGLNHWIDVADVTHKRLTKAKNMKKGVRITLSPDEIANSGEGFMDILKSIGRAANWVKSNVIDSNLYQSSVKPIVRGLVNTAVAAIPPNPLTPVINSAVDTIGQKTNAFGLKKDEDKVTNLAKSNLKKRSRNNKSTGASFLLN